MSMVSINELRIGKPIKASVWDLLAKKALIKSLEKLPRGRLVIEDCGEIFEFGSCGGAEVDNETLCAHVFIHHPCAYRDMLLGGSIGAAEGFMRGSWGSPNLVDVIRLMAMNIQLLNRIDNTRPLLKRFSAKLIHLLNHNSRQGSRKNIAAHYDLGNDFFKLFLDPTMMYSAAIFPDATTSLEQASVFKLDAVCKKLNLGAGDHLLEIGTGWGGLALHAASQYGCRVTTTTISRQQYEYAKSVVVDAGLEDRITLLLEDYRNLQGKYDKLVSIEMIEAVGHEYYQDYFSQCSRLLKSDGVMLIQAITIPDQRYEEARRNVDFIQRYIFPGGSLPSIEVIARCVARHTDMQIVGLQDIGLDYAKTLAAWRDNFHARRDDITAMGFDEVFRRMWEFYFCYCEGGFAQRAISTAQIMFAKPDARTIAVAQ